MACMKSMLSFKSSDNRYHLWGAVPFDKTQSSEIIIDLNGMASSMKNDWSYMACQELTNMLAQVWFAAQLLITNHVSVSWS